MIDGPNMYGYVRGNPLRYVDRHGLSVLGDIFCFLLPCFCDDEQEENAADKAGEAARKSQRTRLDQSLRIQSQIRERRINRNRHRDRLRNRRVGALEADHSLVRG